MLKDQYTIEELEAHRTEWLAALRSGKYKQGLSVLKRNNDTYCCLGVACELAGLIAKESESYYYIYGDNFTGMLPPEVQKYYGFLDNLGSSLNGTWAKLSYMNDSEVYTFAQIADHVELHMEDYFTNVE